MRAAISASAAANGLHSAAALALVAAAALLVFLPTLDNGFLVAAFDDQLLLDDPHVRQLDPASLWALMTSFRHANYVPLTMLTFALQYPLSGVDPAPYHLVNVLLHAATAVALWWFIRPLVGARWVATVAALIFALHPIQLEAVSLVIQRKTLLSGLFVLLALIAYQHWCQRRRWPAYALSLLAFVAAAAAKPTAVTLPLVLLLYDAVFVGGRMRLVEKAPFFAIAAAFAWAATAASQAVGAIFPPHSGTWLGHLLIVARATMDGGVAILLPIALSPIYYYRAGTQFELLNVAALAALGLLAGLVMLRRRQYPWAFFCAGWFVLMLLPQSNLLPLAQLRPDRYVYLSMAGFAVAVAVGLRHLADILPTRPPWRVAIPALGVLYAALLGAVTMHSVGVWRDDVTAWQRVVERNRWSATAHMMLGEVYEARDNTAAAERLYLEATRVQPLVAAPYLHLARLYARNGAPLRAAQAARQYLERAPDSPQRASLARLAQHD